MFVHWGSLMLVGALCTGAATRTIKGSPPPPPRIPPMQGQHPNARGPACPVRDLPPNTVQNQESKRKLSAPAISLIPIARHVDTSASGTRSNVMAWSNSDRRDDGPLPSNKRESRNRHTEALSIVPTRCSKPSRQSTGSVAAKRRTRSLIPTLRASGHV